MYPFIADGLFLHGLHRTANAQVKKFRERKLTKGEGVIDHYYTDNGYEKYYLRFQVHGKTVVKEAVCTHCGKKGYEMEVPVPIAYHVNKKESNLFLYAALIVAGIAMICVIKALLQG